MNPNLHNLGLNGNPAEPWEPDRSDWYSRELEEDLDLLALQEIDLMQERIDLYADLDAEIGTEIDPIYLVDL